MEESRPDPVRGHRCQEGAGGLFRTEARPAVHKLIASSLVFFAAAFDVDGHVALAEMLTGTCPPGHVREVILGSTSLYVDGQWPVDLYGNVDDADVTNTCSSQLTLGGVGIVVFEDLNVTLTQEMNKRRVRFDWFRLYQSPPTIAPDTALIPSAPDRRLVLPEGTIEDITEKRLKNKTEDPTSTYIVAPNKRHYRLQHRAANEPLPEPFVVRCGNLGTPNASSRICRTMYKYGSGIVVEYLFRPNDLTFPQRHYGMNSDTISEPDGFLALDARLRAWIADMQARPE